MLITHTIEPSLHVPADAVIDSGTKKIVYVDAGNSTFEPRPVETGWRLGRRVEITRGLMPGERVIVSGNFLIDSESRMRTAAGGVIPAMSKDPVCGMYVNEEYARLTGKTAISGDKTYYFCMDTCKESFEKDPAKYLKGVVLDNAHAEHITMKMDRKSWLEMLEPAMGKHTVIDTGDSAEKEGNDSIDRPATFPGVVDWDGPNPKKEGEPPRDWSGWGKFPGADYLGIQDEKEEEPEQEDDVSEVESDPDPGDEPADHGEASRLETEAEHTGMKHEMEEPPAAIKPEQPADR